MKDRTNQIKFDLGCRTKWDKTLMQPSMGTLNSPSSKVVKDMTSSRRRILRYKNVGIGESSPILFLNLMNLHLIIFEAW